MMPDFSPVLQLQRPVGGQSDVSSDKCGSAPTGPPRATAGQRVIADASLVAMSGSTNCPGCGLELPTPTSGLIRDPRGNASSAVWQAWALERASVAVLADRLLQ